jgi:hypothetical protein
LYLFAPPFIFGKRVKKKNSKFHMKNFLKKIKLIDHLSTELPISKDQFIEKLSNIIDHGGIGTVSSAFEAFSGSSNELRGRISTEGFELKRKRKLFDTKLNSAIAKGVFIPGNGKLSIETEINGFSSYMIFIFCFATFIYLLIFIFLFSSSTKDTLIAAPFVLIHAAFMYLIPYFMMHRSVSRLKYDLEREFFYLTKDK